MRIIVLFTMFLSGCVIVPTETMNVLHDCDCEDSQCKIEKTKQENSDD